MSTLPRVLVVEDEVAIQELLRFTLVQTGFDAVIVSNAEDALKSITSELPAVVLLDLMLPGMLGNTLAKRLRADARTRDLPIIMVTACAEEMDRVQGLELGADDYVTKPFSPKELIARIRAVLRRRVPHKAGDPIEAGPLRLDPAQHILTLNGKALELGPTEFELLQFLMHHPNRVHSRDQLLNVLRGDPRFLEDRTIDVYIRRLRAGLGEEAESMIVTVRGLGYKLVPPQP